MVKVGFIVEGDTEKKIIKSESFQNLCKNNNIEILADVFPPKGKRGKDVFKNAEKLEAYLSILEDKGAKYVFVIRDLEELNCVVEARNEISTQNAVKIIVVKAIESWFIADIASISIYFEQNFYQEFPENIEKPFEFLKQNSLKIKKRGIKDKLIFAGTMLSNGFSIESAANHPNCPSAKYFIKKLETLN